MRLRSLYFLLPLIAAFSFSCSEEETFETLGNKVAGPVDITQDGTYFYVLNSDIDRIYNQGSILVIDQNGSKVSVTNTPRLGRFIRVRGNTVIAGFGPVDQYETKPSIKFYDSSDPTNLSLQHSIELPCSPVNAHAPAGYQYFAVSCIGGKIFMGTWGASIADTTLTEVRQPDGNTRRALYIDTTRQILFAFPTDWGDPDYQDGIFTDEKSFDDEFNETLAANETPDVWESSLESKEAIETTGRDLQYKFLVYDIASEAAQNFPLRANDTAEAKLEMRWMYFNAARSNPSIGTNQKYYRSNFWQALSHESDVNSFYLSQRGDEQDGVSPDSNAIYRFQITANPLPTNGIVPTTSSFFTVTAAYGHEATPAVTAKTRYTGNFALGSASGQTYFAVNDFKDKTFSRSSAYFDAAHYNIGFQTTTGSWADSIVSTSRKESYFAVSAIGGRVLMGSFFTDKLILVEISPGSAINRLTTIN